jgi:phage shock protein PspC (stress-responsive transcriptional regulator)
MIAGVAGGIAEYFDIDPVIVRAIFIISFFGAGASVLAYIILWIIVPDESRLIRPAFTDSNEATEVPQYNQVRYKKKESGSYIFGIVLMTLGVILLLENISDIDVFGNLWPLTLVVVGLYLLLRNKKEDNKLKEAE